MVVDVSPLYLIGHKLLSKLLAHASIILQDHLVLIPVIRPFYQMQRVTLPRWSRYQPSPFSEPLLHTPFDMLESRMLKNSPSPSRQPRAQYPRYWEPSAHRNSPQPWNLPLRKEPLQTDPSQFCSQPWPPNSSSSKSPLQMQLPYLQTPFALSPFSKLPLKLKSSPRSSPYPCLRSSLNSPRQEQSPS